MKPYTILVFTFLSFSQFGWSQETSDILSRRSNIEAQKVSFITSELELTPKQAQDFWPLYNAYRNEIQKLRKAGKQGSISQKKSDKELTDKELDEIMKREFVLDREKIDLDEKYYELYKTVLPVSKVIEFYAAERDFKRELLKTLKDKRGQ